MYTKLACVALGMWMAFAGSAAAQDAGKPPPRTITVTGAAEVRVVPDIVTLTAEVETFAKTIPAAKKENDELVARALKVATEFGLPAADVQTSEVSISPRYRTDERGRADYTVVIGYEMSKTIGLRLKEPARFEALLTALLNAGVNRVTNIQFDTSELRKHRDEARAQALRAAREKATAMAGVLEQTVGRPLTITEEGGGTFNPYSNRWGNAQQIAVNYAGEGGGAADVGATFALGVITVKASVSVTFELQ